MKKITMFNILACAVLIDIILTFVMVIYFNASELNPLCTNFDIFFIVKCVVSIIILAMIRILSKKRWVNKYIWLSNVYFLILWYNFIILKNLYEIGACFFI